MHAALATPVRNPVGKMGLEYRRRWWEEDDRIYGGITETNIDLRRIWYPSYGFHSERGVVIGYHHTGHHARSYGALTPTERVQRAVAQGVKIHGAKYQTELDSAFSVAWHRMPFIECGWTSWPKRPSAPYQRLLEPAGRMSFAGDWLCYLIGWQAGAFASARAVVTALHQRVLSTSPTRRGIGVDPGPLGMPGGGSSAAFHVPRRSLNTVGTNRTSSRNSHG